MSAYGICCMSWSIEWIRQRLREHLDYRNGIGWHLDSVVCLSLYGQHEPLRISRRLARTLGARIIPISSSFTPVSTGYPIEGVLVGFSTTGKPTDALTELLSHGEIRILQDILI